MTLSGKKKLRHIAPYSASVLAVAAVLAASAAHGQEAATEEEAFSDEDIIVIAESLAGRVDAPQAPIEELDQEDIAAYGAGSLGELIQALGSQTGSARGRGSGPPVFLVNGVRVSSFREMRSYPPEAVEKIEILPEEVAQRFGYPPDARVINFILKDGFSSREIELEYGQPDRGGYSRKEVEATYLKIDGPSRLNLNLEWNDVSPLTESERGVIQTDRPDLASDPDPAGYRSLIADSSALEFTGNWSTQLSEAGSSLSLNLTAERNDSMSLFGLDTVLLTDPAGNSLLRSFNEDGPLMQDTRTDTLSTAATLNAPVGGWQLTATVDAGRTDTSSVISRRADTGALVADAAAGLFPIDGPITGIGDAGFDEASTLSHEAKTLVTMIGQPIWLPAGGVNVTLDAGYAWNNIESEDTRNPGLVTDLTRGDLSAGINLGIPISSVRDDHWAAIGDLTLNLNAGVDHLSDFGTLTDWSAGLTWGVTEKLTLSATRVTRDAAPSLTQLGNPEIVTPNVPVFDLVNSETVLANITSGGNPGLVAETQRDWIIGANWELPIEGARLQVNYFRNHSDNVTSAFPVLTPEIEAAFPDRVTRDTTGRLIALDRRPITLAEQKSSRLQFGLNISGSIGSSSGGSGVSNRGGGNPPTSRPRGPGDANAAGGFDPQRFQELRERLCSDPSQGGQTPEEMIAQLPDRFQARFRNDQGEIDPARVAEFRTRICSSDGQPAFDPERFAAIRAQFCADPQPGEARKTPEEMIAELPEQMQARFRNEQGEIDAERVAEFRERICSGDGPPGLAAPAGGGERAARGGRGGRGPGGFGPGGGGNGGRWFANINHTIQLDSTVLVTPGGPTLDLLDGDALGSGGTPRHSTELAGGLFYNGFGTRLSANYAGPTRIDGSGLPGSTDLFFGDLLTFDLRMFADLGRQEKLVEKMPFLKNVRVSLGVDNLFDARQRVTDSNGEVPLSYQPFLLDPAGRFIEFEIRKIF